MRDMWLAVGPVDELADIVANIIIADPAVEPVLDRQVAGAAEGALRASPTSRCTTRDDITDRLGEITCPAVVMHGTEDTAISMDRAEALAGGLSGAGPVVKVGGAHAANLTNPGPVNEAIVEFLASLARLTGGVCRSTASPAFPRSSRAATSPR